MTISYHHLHSTLTSSYMNSPINHWIDLSGISIFPPLDKTERLSYFETLFVTEFQISLCHSPSASVYQRHLDIIIYVDLTEYLDFVCTLVSICNNVNSHVSLNNTIVYYFCLRKYYAIIY